MFRWGLHKIQVQDLKFLFVITDGDVWRPEKRFKQFDDLALKMFSAENTDVLFSKGIEFIQEAVYFMLHFPLCLMLVKMSNHFAQRLISLCIFTMLRIYEKLNMFEAHGPEKDKISMERGEGVGTVTAFNR